MRKTQPAPPPKLRHLARWLMCLCWPGLCMAQAQTNLPDLSGYRDRRTFQDPYANLENAPEGPAPRTDTTWRVPQVSIIKGEPIEHAWNLWRWNEDTIVQGFRVQVFLGEPEEANRVKFDFMERFGEYGVYPVFEAPYWKVRVGDFETRREAERFLKRARAHFPGAFVVPEVIRLRF